MNETDAALVRKVESPMPTLTLAEVLRYLRIKGMAPTHYTTIAFLVPHFGVFCWDFFDAGGLNCATWVVGGMGNVLLHRPGRVYGVPHRKIELEQGNETETYPGQV